MISCAQCGARVGVVGRCTGCARNEKRQSIRASLIAAYDAREHEIAEGPAEQGVPSTYPIWSMPDDVIAGWLLALHASPDVCLSLLQPFTERNSMTWHIPMEQAKRITALLQASA